MSLPKTFELKIDFNRSLDKVKLLDLKEQVKIFLSQSGYPSFVEGTVDNLDLDFEYSGEGLDPGSEYFDKLGGDLSPIVVYKYEPGPLGELKKNLENLFSTNIQCTLHSIDTDKWLHGWKDSFKPIITKKMIITPPWCKEILDQIKHQLIIEPGLAFGTGQHATTTLCLSRIEDLSEDKESREKSLLDVGTGTGILALAAKFLGFNKILALDIDHDAVAAAKTNAALNDCSLNVFLGTLPLKNITGLPPEFFLSYDIVVANILLRVLEKIISELALVTKKGGKLILSGLLVQDEAEMLKYATPHGLEFVGRSTQDDWLCLELKKL